MRVGHTTIGLGVADTETGQQVIEGTQREVAEGVDSP